MSWRKNCQRCPGTAPGRGSARVRGWVGRPLTFCARQLPRDGRRWFSSLGHFERTGLLSGLKAAAGGSRRCELASLARSLDPTCAGLVAGQCPPKRAERETNDLEALSRGARARACACAVLVGF